MKWDELTECKINSLSIAAMGDRTDVTIGVVGQKNEHWAVSATDVTNLFATEMRLQNIIDDVIVIDASSSETDDVKAALFFLLRQREAETEEDLQLEKILEIVQAIRASKIQLLRIRAIYGVTVVLLARKVVLEPSRVYTENM